MSRSDTAFNSKRPIPGVNPIDKGYDKYSARVITGTQITESEGHPWKYNSHFRGADVGGPFRTEKNYVDDPRGIESPSPMYSLDGVYDIYRYRYFGPVDVDLYTSLPGPPNIESSDAALNALGATAIARCKPTSSAASLSVALGELFNEGLPRVVGHSLWETRLKDIRKSGDEYLNVQFGWLPLVDDVKSVATAVSNSEKIMRQYERDAGRVVRRRYEFPLIRETSSPVLVRAQTHPFFPGVSASPGGLSSAMLRAWGATSTSLSTIPMYSETSKEIRRWFSGAFTYYLPRGYNSRNKVAKAAEWMDKVLGIELTPETLWNLTPWSWAADWVGNIGDVLSNVSDYSTDGLVLRYGYMMEHSISKITYILPNVAFKGRPPVTITQTHVREVKKRVAASPFGFGLTFDSFSTKQKAILAALGITRVR